MPESRRGISMSCSDKLLLVNLLGFHGQHLDLILPNLSNFFKFKTIIIEVEHICD